MHAAVPLELDDTHMMVWLDKKFSNANCRDRRKVSAITQRKAADFENNMGRGILRCRDKISLGAETLRKHPRRPCSEFQRVSPS